MRGRRGRRRRPVDAAEVLARERKKENRFATDDEIDSLVDALAGRCRRGTRAHGLNLRRIWFAGQSVRAGDDGAASDAHSFVIRLQLLVKQTAKSSMKMIAAYLPTGVCAAPVE